LRLGTADPPDKQKELKFDPKLVLKWPSDSSANSHVEISDIGELKHYSAMGSVKKADGIIVFSAFVEEYPEKAVKDISATQRLNTYVLGTKKGEISRKEIEHGPKKCPGLDIVYKSGSFFGRKLVVIVGPRIYEVAVTSKNQELLKGDEVNSFIDSLAVGN
jgi:hypothetical protein